MSLEITLLHFFSWNFIWFGQKEPIRVENFRFSTAQVKFHHICNLIDTFCWKYIQFHLKKVYRSYVSWHWGDMQNLKKNWFVSKMTKIWWTLIWKLEVLKISTLTGFFWAKYITFDLKQCWEVTFHDTDEWWKVWRKTDSWFGKWDEEYDKCLPEHLKISNLRFWWDPLIQNRKCMSLIFTGDSCVLTMRNGAKFERELTCCFKIPMRNLTNFDPSSWTSLLLSKLCIVWLHWRGMQNLERNWLVVSKLWWDIWQILTQALKSFKNVHFNGLLLRKIYIVWAKKVQRSYLSWHW